MKISPATVDAILEAGGNVDVRYKYDVEDITRWIQIAAKSGGHVRVCRSYDDGTLVHWARIGGGHFTIEIAPLAFQSPE